MPSWQLNFDTSQFDFTRPEDKNVTEICIVHLSFSMTRNSPRRNEYFEIVLFMRNVTGHETKFHNVNLRISKDQTKSKASG